MISLCITTNFSNNQVKIKIYLWSRHPTRSWHCGNLVWVLGISVQCPTISLQNLFFFLRSRASCGWLYQYSENLTSNWPCCIFLTCSHNCFLNFIVPLLENYIRTHIFIVLSIIWSVNCMVLDGAVNWIFYFIFRGWFPLALDLLDLVSTWTWLRLRSITFVQYLSLFLQLNVKFVLFIF